VRSAIIGAALIAALIVIVTGTAFADPSGNTSPAPSGSPRILLGDPYEDDDALRGRIEAALATCPTYPAPTTDDPYARASIEVNQTVRCGDHAVGIARARIYTYAVYWLYGNFIDLEAGASEDARVAAEARAKKLIKLALPLSKSDRALTRAIQTYSDEML
jgi:hypothetical protein